MDDPLTGGGPRSPPLLLRSLRNTSIPGRRLVRLKFESPLPFGLSSLDLTMLPASYVPIPFKARRLIPHQHLPTVGPSQNLGPLRSLISLSY